MIMHLTTDVILLLLQILWCIRIPPQLKSVVTLFSMAVHGLVTLTLLVVFVSGLFIDSAVATCASGECQVYDDCSSNEDCAPGLFCFSCSVELEGSRCVRSTVSDPFKIVNNSMPFNKYAFLATHNSFAIKGERLRGRPRVTFTNQEDNVTQQLNNGVRVLMLDTYDYKDDIWLCHSFKGKCHQYTAFEPATDTFREIEGFLSGNPSEIVTLILEDYVKTPNGLSRVFNDAGLMKYWFPAANMPQNGQDWPLVKDMVANNQRLIVFTSDKSKQESEGIAYQWNYMVENQYGNKGLKESCTNRADSAPLDDQTKSLVFVNHFGSIPISKTTCMLNSGELIDTLQECYAAAGNRWANFVAVDYYKRSDGGGAFDAVDQMNGELLCSCGNIHACAPGSSANCIRPE